jgi:hypothetical protein
VPRRLVVQVLRLLRARTVAHLGRDGTRTADAEADAELRHRSMLAWLVQIDAWGKRRRGELTFDAMTWWMGKLERAVVCGMDCGSRVASGA